MNIYNATDQKKYPVFQAQALGTLNGKKTFYLTEELFNNPSYQALANAAVRDLSCATAVQFELASSSVPNTDGGLVQDGKSVISLADDNEFEREMQLMTTQRYTTSTCTNGGERWFITSESDIIIKRSANWSTTSAVEDLPAGAYDFYAALLHELAHAAGLDHVINEYALMKPYADKGELASAGRFSYEHFPNDASVEGIGWVLSEGDKKVYDGSSCQQYQKMIRKNVCGIVTSKQREASMAPQPSVLNPVTGAAIEVRQGGNKKAYHYQLIQVNGTLAQEGELEAASNSIALGNMPKGMYLLSLRSESETYQFKLIRE